MDIERKCSRLQSDGKKKENTYRDEHHEERQREEDVEGSFPKEGGFL